MKNRKNLKAIAVAVSAILVAAAIAVPIALFARGDLSHTELPEDFSFALADFDGIQKEKDTDIRVMSANLLVSYKSWGGEPVKPRAKQFVELVEKTAPDIIGAQEVCGDWHACLDANLPQYEIVHPQNNLFQKSLTTLLYNTETLRCIDSGRMTYTEGDGTKHRAVTWGVFETIAGGRRFIATSTHLDLIREGKEDAERGIMLLQAEEFFTLLSDLKAKYDCPAFCTGDYNSMENDSEKGVFAAAEIYETFAARLQDAKFCATVQSVGTEEAWDYPSWDHIFMDGDAEILAFRVCSEPFLKDMSDHYPIFADVSLH